MTQYIREYSPENVEVNWGGKFEVTGFADGTMVEASRNSPRTNVVVGAKGDPAITRTADKTGTLTLTLLQNSPANQYFSAVVNGEDLGDLPLIRADMTVKDPSGSMLCYAKRCHIQEPAPITLGDGQNAKVWTFYVEELTYANVPQGLYDKLAGVDDVTASLRTLTEELTKISGN